MSLPTTVHDLKTLVLSYHPAIVVETVGGGARDAHEVLQQIDSLFPDPPGINDRLQSN